MTMDERWKTGVSLSGVDRTTHRCREGHRGRNPLIGEHQVLWLPSLRAFRCCPAYAGPPNSPTLQHVFFQLHGSRAVQSCRKMSRSIGKRAHLQQGFHEIRLMIQFAFCVKAILISISIAYLLSEFPI